MASGEDVTGNDEMIVAGYITGPVEGTRDCINKCKCWISCTQKQLEPCSRATFDYSILSFSKSRARKIINTSRAIFPVNFGKGYICLAPITKTHRHSIPSPLICSFQLSLLKGNLCLHRDATLQTRGRN